MCSSEAMAGARSATSAIARFRHADASTLQVRAERHRPCRASPQPHLAPSPNDGDLAGKAIWPRSLTLTSPPCDTEILTMQVPQVRCNTGLKWLSPYLSLTGLCCVPPEPTRRTRSGPPMRHSFSCSFTGGATTLRNLQSVELEDPESIAPLSAAWQPMTIWAADDYLAVE